MNEISGWVEKFNSVVNDANQLISVARDTELQKAAVQALADLSTELETWKKHAIASGNEDVANLILAMECVAACLASEITMYILLKAGKPEKAWDSLVDAQSNARDAIHAHPSFAHIATQVDRLHMIEKIIFPPQMFLSAGLIVERTICTICGQDYEECSHVVGFPYWGFFCRRQLKGIRPDHVALVKNPANKRCRITHYSVEGGMRNRMTYRVEPHKADEMKEVGNTGMLTRAILMSADDLVS